MDTTIPSDPRYRVLVDALDEGFVFQDRNGRVVFSNPAASRILGLSADQLEGRTAYDPDWHAEFEDGSHDPTRHPSVVALATGQPVANVVMRVAPSGCREVWVSINARPVFDRDETVPSGVVVSFTDITMQRSTQRALRESVSRFRMLFDATDDAVQFFDAETLRLLDFNEANVRMYGYTSAELAGLSILDLSAEPEQTRHFADTAVAGGTFQVPKRLHRRRDGSTFPVAISTGTFELDGSLVGYALVRDISESVAAEEAVRDSEHWLATLLQHSSDVVMVVDANGTLAYVSPSAPELFGFPHGSHLGTDILDLVHPDDLARTRAALAERLATTARRDPFELRVAHANGGWRHIELVASNLIDDVAINGIVLNVRDITERRQAEAAIRSSEERLNALLRHSSDIIVVIDATGTLQMVSLAAERMLGLEIGSWIGRDILDLVHPEDREEAELSLLNTVAVPGSHPPLEVRVTNADHSWRPVEVVANNLLHTGSIDGIVLNVRDISERLRIEAALRDADLDRERRDAEIERNRLEAELSQAQRLESLGRLAGGVAHDFNNLLGVILNYAGFIAKRLDPSDPIAADVIEIRRAAQRAAELTRQLLLFGRREVVRAGVFDLNEVIDAAMPMFRRALGDVELEVHLTPHATPVYADRGQIEQVLMNLLLNAADATAGTGTVSVSTILHDADEGSSKGAFIELSVSDNGQGMTPEVLDQAFEPFFTTKSRDRGSGLGLASVHGIVTRAGGDIAIESRPGLGTTVTVSLSVAEVHSASAPVTTAATVLVVDDEPELRAVTTRILRESGYCVLEASSAREALGMLHGDAAGTSLVLTDVVMPEMSGPELARELAVSRPDIRVLLMSGYAHDDMERDDELLATLLPKPFSEDQLLGAVRAALLATARS